MVTSPVNLPVSSTVRVSPKANQQPCAAGPNSSQQPPCVSAAPNPSQQQSRVPAETAPTSDGVPRNSNNGHAEGIAPLFLPY